jgi:hypothetical protein
MGIEGWCRGGIWCTAKANETHCFGGVQSFQGIPFAIFEDVLLKAQFVVLDLGKKRVGFANKLLTS